MVKSIGYSFTGLQFSHQHPYIRSQVSVTPVLGDPTPSLDPQGHWTQVGGIQGHMQANHPSHKIFLKIIKTEFSYTILEWGHKHLDHCASCVAMDTLLSSSVPQYSCF